jgi:RNA recognition motif-containing protein
MSSDYSPRSGGAPRRRRRGGRSRTGERSTTPRPEGSGRAPSRGGARKPGFFDKLKSLLGLGAKPKRTPERSSEPKGERSQHPTLRRAEEQQRSERRKDSAPRAERSERPERAERPEKAERAPRPRPELEEANPDAVVVPRLYVGNLSYDTAESDLFDLFSKVGSVKNVELVMDHRNNRSKGFGFVEMAELETAKKAVVELHKSDFMGRQLVVSGAKSERRIESAPAPEQPPIE